ncbi:MAG: hypothetical protein EBY09_18065, partial [Verrucomicrobia bacterium]|nr:hypothetical protein [Verrucomicrobiota bacterium]NDD38140.1 hypothetical protein [Verrucomicrobiota bacterium]NDF00050.1 hypothetical protein [Verrucomicrobiota bacterium]
MTRLRFFHLTLGALLLGSVAPAQVTHFRDQIKPLLDQKCVSCHGADKQKGGLRLDSRAVAGDAFLVEQRFDLVAEMSDLSGRDGTQQQ